MDTVLHMIALFTAVLVIVTGFAVLALGEWTPFKLKFAGVALSTSAALWMVIVLTIYGDTFYCGINQDICFTVDIYHVIRNLALLIFHIAVGRDAIVFSKYERRGKANG